MKIVFMGTPEFAVTSLERLAASGHQIVRVVTPPDRPKGRGRKLAKSFVKLKAEALDIPILQPEDLKDPAFVEALKFHHADCYAVVGFRILPPEIFEIPPKGTVNLHASLLPKYRGAAPIQWAIINGEKESGVTTFFIQRRVDTGSILLQQKMKIHAGETAGELHDRMAVEGAELLVRTMNGIENGSLQAVPQQGEATKAPKILPEHCRIDWQQPADKIINLIRGLSPRPGAYAMMEGKRFKIHRADFCPHGKGPVITPGTVLHHSRNTLCVATGCGSIRLVEVQAEGARRMTMDEFLRGRSIEEGTVLA